jgi:hypothetical protein
MKKAFLAFAAAATIALSTLATPTTADARCRGCAVGAGVAAGVLGAAIIGGAIANSPAYAYPRTYYPVAGYEPYPAYAGAAPYGCPGGYWARRPIRDGYGHVVGWSRPRFFCPY